MSGDSFLKGGRGKHKRTRKYVGGAPRPDLNELKQKEAIERTEAWQKLSPEQQLEALDRRLGAGSGAERQRARLSLEIERRKHQAKPELKGAQPLGQLITAEDGGRIKAKDRRATEQAKRSGR